MPTARLATIDRAVVRCRTISNGTTGSATRDSTHTAMARIASPAPTIAAVCQDIQANELSTNDTQINSTLTPAAISDAPR
jgi:hypothetical protein